MELPLLQFIDKVFYVPVVQVQQVRGQLARRQSRSHCGSSSFCVDTVVHVPGVVNDRCWMLQTSQLLWRREVDQLMAAMS